MTGNETRPEADFCWNRIGMWAAGIPSCPKLKEHIHCRNCPDFHDQARDLMKIPPPEGYLEEWSRQLAADREKEADLSEAIFTFRIGEEWLALPAITVREVTRPSTIHRIPRKSDQILLGLVNIKGSLQLCFSLQNLLGLESAATRSEQAGLFGVRFIEMERDGFAWVFAVEEVGDIHRFDLDQMMNIPPTVSHAGANYTKTVFRHRDTTVALLDDELIISFLKRRIL